MNRRAAPARWLLVGLLAGAWSSGVRAERPLLADELPAELEGVGIVERLNEPVPMDLAFVDETGRAVTLRDVFPDDRPTILTLNYFRCPMLCSLTLNGLVDGLKELDRSVGADFDIVTVSISPDEGPELADVKKRAYLTQYPRETAATGWHFLTGRQPAIEELARAVGFGYRKIEGTGEYAHTASIIFVTPDGRISRYMNNVVFEPRDLRLALVEASEGTIGSPMEKLLLLMCYHYDPEAGSYAMSAVKLMRLGGLVTVVAIVAGLLLLWRHGPVRREKTTLDELHS